MREKEEVFNGKLTSLKRFKDDVKEVTTEYECGIVCDKFSEFEVRRYYRVLSCT